MNLRTLAEALHDWTDWDIAEHELACVLGIVDEEKGSFGLEFKWIYWSNNRTGNTLGDILTSLMELGFLEYDKEEEKLRHNAGFDVLKVDKE